METYINDQVRPSHEGGGIGSEEDSNAIQFIDVSKAVHRGARAPHFLLGLEGRDTVQSGIYTTISGNFPKLQQFGY